MDIQELKYVLALAEYQNFTVAAEACSPVSYTHLTLPTTERV